MSAEIPYPAPSSPAVTAVMKGNRRVDTKPERLLRSALHRRGLRFRKDYRVVVGDGAVRPDVVFTRKRVAVFVDGCFWHGCPAHGRVPRASNPEYWRRKLQRNIDRDHDTRAALRAAGWVVVRVWEHEEVEDAIQLVLEAVREGQANGTD